ncbi:MAG TPA: hypothetical protein VHW24_18085 [Bryobacteraceae bacterium]|jgi:hypothetical protein|nr:hypothetical protein [Bryobacteraceae bacterium]
MMPTGPQSPGEHAERGAYGQPGPVAVGRLERRPRRGRSLLLVLFCYAIGFILVIFPWTPSWDMNYFATIDPQWRQFWNNLYFRGAISGLGVVNIYIAMLELYRLRRFAGR